MKRLLIGILLVAVAAFLALFLKDYLDQKNPESAIPQLTVTADATDVETYLSNYYWRFLSGTEVQMTSPMLEQLDLGLGLAGWEDGFVPSTELGGGERLRFFFSQQETVIHVDRTDAYDYRFNPADDDTVVPYQKGVYYYRVTAEFERGRVESYFRINVV